MGGPRGIRELQKVLEISGGSSLGVVSETSYLSRFSSCSSLQFSLRFPIRDVEMT